MQAVLRSTAHPKLRLRVSVIGGLTRATHLWTRAGDQCGFDVTHLDGTTHGGRIAEITAAVRRADVVVIITDPNSHGGVAAARRAAIAARRPHVLVKRLRPGDLCVAIAAATQTPPA